MHAELGRPTGHAGTPLDDQQAMLGLYAVARRMRRMSLQRMYDITFPKAARPSEALRIPS